MVLWLLPRMLALGMLLCNKMRVGMLEFMLWWLLRALGMMLWLLPRMLASGVLLCNKMRVGFLVSGSRSLEMRHG